MESIGSTFIIQTFYILDKYLETFRAKSKKKNKRLTWQAENHNNKEILFSNALKRLGRGVLSVLTGKRRNWIEKDSSYPL